MIHNWFPVAGFRLALEVAYTRVETAFDGQTISLSKTQGSRPTGTLHGQGPGHPVGGVPRSTGLRLGRVTH